MLRGVNLLLNGPGGGALRECRGVLKNPLNSTKSANLRRRHRECAGCDIMEGSFSQPHPIRRSGASEGATAEMCQILPTLEVHARGVIKSQSHPI